MWDVFEISAIKIWDRTFVEIWDLDFGSQGLLLGGTVVPVILHHSKI